MCVAICRWWNVLMAWAGDEKRNEINSNDAILNKIDE